MSTTGALNEHLFWHQSHGSGSDDHFMFWHRYYLRWLEDYLGAQSADFSSPVPYWPSNTPIPSELSAGTVDTTPNVTPPSWTTMAGGTTSAPFFGYTSLGQFKSTAELGRAIGASYHGTVHGTVGGTMATFSSPLAPIFYPWHGYIDHIWAEWQRRTMALPVAVVRGQVESTNSGAVRINLFVRRADGRLWERYWNGSTWTWVDTGKAVYGRVVPLVRGDVDDVDANGLRINLFVQGADRKLWERYWNGSAWSWVDTGKEVDGEPLILARGNLGSASGSSLRINLFVRGVDGKLWERYWNGSAWTWVDTGKAVSGDPIAVVRGDTDSVNGADVRINLFVRGADNILWERYWNGSTWAWADTGKQVSDDPVALVRGNMGSPGGGGIRINLFVRGMDGRLWERYWNGSAWTWVDTGKPADGEPVALIRGNTDSVNGADVRINLFAPILQATLSGGPTPHTHYDIRLWERYWNGAAWAWVDTGRDIRGKPVAMVRGDVEEVGTSGLRINLWVAGDDGRLWERYWNGSAWAWVDTGADVAI
jgi:hypothetical protein